MPIILNVGADGQLVVLYDDRLVVLDGDRLFVLDGVAAYRGRHQIDAAPNAQSGSFTNSSKISI